MAAILSKHAVILPVARAPDVLRRTSPRWAVLAGAVAMFALLVAAYIASIDIRASRGASITGDEPFYLLTTQSLLQDRDLDLRQQYERRSYESFFDHPSGLWQQSVPREDGTLLSPHNPGLAVLLLPGFAVAGLVGAQAQMLVMAALTFSLTYLLVVRETGEPAWSWVATFLVALSATAFIYATEVYPEIPAALVLVVSLLLLQGRLGPWRTLVLAASLSVMVWLGIKYAPLAGLVASWAFWRMDSQARAFFLVASGISCVLFVGFHLRTFGSLTPYSISAIYAGDTTASVLDQHLGFVDRSYRLLGLWVDQRFGIGRWAPVLLLAAPALVLLWCRDGPSTGSGPGLARLVLALALAQLLMAAFVAITMMGWWFPGRTLMVVLPLLALPLSLLMPWLPVWGRVGVGLLGAYSLAITAALARAGQEREIVIAVDPFDMRSPLFQTPSILFPNYTFWDMGTWGLTAAWLVIIGVVALVLYRKYWTSNANPAPGLTVATPATGGDGKCLS